MDKATHVRAALRRHSSPGTLLLLVFFAIVFFPRLWDLARGEPRIENVINIVTNSSGEVLVHDLTVTRGGVQGVRAATIEVEDGSVVCSTEHHNTWRGERNRFWRVSAFTSCMPPKVPYRICSSFSVESESSGRRRFLGPFCSSFTLPPESFAASRF